MYQPPTSQQEDYMRFGEFTTQKMPGKYQIDSGYTNLLILFVILIVGLWIFAVILKELFNIDLTNTQNRQNRLIIGAIALFSVAWIMNIITSGNIGNFGRRIERGDRFETAGLKRVAERFKTYS